MNREVQPLSSDQSQLVVAIFDDRTHAEAAVQDLQRHGFAGEQLSVLFRHDGVATSAEDAVALEREAEETSEDVAIGGTVGGLAGLLGGLAVFSIPVLGPFLGVGVLAATIGGAAIGSALGERIAHLTTLGVPQERTQRYGTALEAGHIVLAVSTSSAEQVMQAREVLTLHQADEIDVHARQAAEM
jgi:uncharacterized membrane protein